MPRTLTTTSMKYQILDQPVNEIVWKKEIKFNDSYGFETPGSFYQLDQTNYKEFVPAWPEFNIDYGYPITDYLYTHFGGDGLFVSEKLKTLMDEIYLPEHRFFPVKFRSQFEHLNYYYLIYDELKIENFLFQDSKFSIINELQEKRDKVFSDITDYNNFLFEQKSNKENLNKLFSPISLPPLEISRDLIKLRANTWSIEKTLFCSLKTNNSYDLISIPYQTDHFISNHFSQLLVQNGISGIQLRPCSSLTVANTT